VHERVYEEVEPPIALPRLVHDLLDLALVATIELCVCTAELGGKWRKLLPTRRTMGEGELGPERAKAARGVIADAIFGRYSEHDASPVR